MQMLGGEYESQIEYLKRCVSDTTTTKNKQKKREYSNNFDIIIPKKTIPDRTSI